MSSNTLIGIWASGVWQTDLYSTPNVSALTISGYAVQPSTLATLNLYLSTCYSGSGYSGPGTVNSDVVPDLCPATYGILEQMYLISYWGGLANSIMGQGSDNPGGGLPFTVIRDDGGLTLQRANPAQIGNTYAVWAKQARDELWRRVNAYVLNVQGANLPRSVSYPDLVYPIWGTSYVNG